MRKIEEIIIHCTDTYSDMDVDIELIRKWHVEERGWSDVGYHYLIRRDGSVETGRDINRPGAHAVGHNSHSIGLAIAGGKARGDESATNFTQAQWNSLEDFVVSLVEQFPDANVIGHNDVSSKDCPTFDVKQWWSEL
tara:strand:- start:408 stop:818 length:411 start_codon:yes stop_codon:yes gene_type:complete